MANLKFEKKESLSREDAAALLSEIAKALASDGEFKLERSGEELKLDVADEVRVEFEVEIDDEETELELELKWFSGKASAAQAASRAAPRKARARPRQAGQRKKSDPGG